MSFVAIDLGASGTRYVSDPGKISLMANNMVFLDIDAKVDLEPYANDVANALEVNITKEGDSSFFPVKALVGQMAERYSSTNERPSVMSNKHVQRINYISGIVAVALSKLAHNLTDDIYLYVALPPIECKTAKSVLKENFGGKYTVELPKYNGGVTVEINIVDVFCYEESFMAMLSYFFDMNGVPRDTAAKYRTGNILSMDIGASTTDLAIIKNGSYLDKTGQTYKTGGNIARDLLIDAVRGQYGFDLPIEEAETTVAEGRLQLGNTYEVITDIEETAKRAFAQSVVSQMQGYFRQVNIPIQSIRAIVVSGGGSMSSQYIDENSEIIETSKPMSHWLTEPMTEICKGVEVEAYGEDSRLANIKGLFIRAKVDTAKRAAKQATVQA